LSTSVGGDGGGVSDGVGGALLPRSTTTGGVAAGSSDGPAAKADEAARRTIGTRRKFSERMAPHPRDDVIGPELMEVGTGWAPRFGRIAVLWSSLSQAAQ
jgi:hypothetical protein